MNSTAAGLASRIRYFRFVRDIPYHIALGEEQDYCCATKPFMLDRLLSTLGLESKRITCTFRWRDLDLPKQVIAIPHDDDDTHEFLLVRIPESESWVRVDPNWDVGLKGTGLPIAEWNGKSDTQLAVKAVKIFSIEESERVLAEEATAPPEVRRAYLEKNLKFFDAINRWLADYRVKSA